MLIHTYQPLSQHAPSALISTHALKRDAFRVYDVFRTPDSTKIIAICSPLHSLHQFLFPLKIFLENKPTQHRLSVYPIQRMSEANYFIEIDIPSPLQSQKSLKLGFKWKCFEHECDVLPNPFAQKGTNNMSLCTLQKDNPIEWIEDWITYYHNVHHIDQVVLYDNDSQSFDKLHNALSNIDLDLKISLVRWHFPYPLGQLGALNHCYQMLGDTSRYYLNFDIDEYLVNTSPQSLLEILDEKTTNHFLNLSVPGYWAHPILNKDLSLEQSCRVTDFLYRPQSGRLSCAPKTIFARQGLAYIHVHQNYTLSDQQQCLSITQKPYTLSYLKLKLKQWLVWLELPWQKARSQRLSQNIQKMIRWFRGLSHKLQKKRMPSLLATKQPKIKQEPTLYFNHYYALTTGWNTPERLKSAPYNPEYHTTDTAMQSMLSYANLKDSKR